MAEAENDKTLDPGEYEEILEAIGTALGKISLATKQLEAVRSTLEAGLPALGEIDSSEEARMSCEVYLIAARLLSPLAQSNLMEAADMVGEALGQELEDEEEEE